MNLNLDILPCNIKNILRNKIRPGDIVDFSYVIKDGQALTYDVHFSDKPVVPPQSETQI